MLEGKAVYQLAVEVSDINPHVPLRCTQGRMPTHHDLPQSYKDRSDMIVFFGSMKVLVAFIFLVLLVVSVVGFLPAREQMIAQVPRGLWVYMGMIYLALTSFFFVVGIGVSLVKKWAHSIMLVVSWFWLVCGILALVWSAIMLSKVFGKMQTEIGAEYLRIAQLITYGFMFLFMVLLPAIFVVFYAARNVKMTFQSEDKREYCTEKCPLPVLSLFLLMILGAVFLIFYVFMPIPFPIFGLLLRGVPARLLWLCIAAASAYVGYRAYKLDLKGWAVSIALIGFLLLSHLVTYLIRGTDELYLNMGYDRAQVELYSELYRSNFLWFLVPTGLLYIGYFAWVKRFFTVRAREPS